MSLCCKIISIVFLNLLLMFNLLGFECKRIKRVIAGTEVPCGTQVEVVSLRDASNSRHLCGATLLTPLFAITAAHCVKYGSQRYMLHLNNYCNKNNTTPKTQVLEVIKHPLYNGSTVNSNLLTMVFKNNLYGFRITRAHDIALLRLRLNLDDITWRDNTTLPNSSFGISGECVIYGYGYRDTKTKQISEELFTANVKIISLDKCSQILGQFVAPESDYGMLCAVGDGVDTCQGDSGGPLICAGNLEGITSYGTSCGLPGIPGVYTSIGSNINWIKRIMGIIQ